MPRGTEYHSPIRPTDHLLEENGEPQVLYCLAMAASVFLFKRGSLGGFNTITFLVLSSVQSTSRIYHIDVKGLRTAL